MAVFEIVRYEARLKQEWDRFAGLSRNSTFLFRRDYVDYHSDRFNDFSLLAFKKGRLVAALPANVVTDSGNGIKVLQSHGGLTYGGWMLPQAHFDGADMLGVFESAADFCRSAGIDRIDYKPLPAIYASMPSGEDIYALYRCGATLSSVMMSSAIDMRSNRGFNTLRRRGLRRAMASGASVAEVHDPISVMNLVAGCLASRHNGARPVHTAAEMSLLASRFPENIRFFTASMPDCAEIDACVVVYDTGIVAHCQYIASSERGRREDLLTLLFDRLINVEFADRRYFDFGTSNEAGGMILNEGLLRQKASLGGTAVPYMRFILDL